MQRELKICRERALGAVLLLMSAILTAQAPSTATQAASQIPQAVSQTGVFPVFAVSMNFEGSLVDGAGVPSKSANNGVDSTIQQAWDTLKTSGFNTILFKVDLNDPQAAARTANLCIWAKANNASLIPVLANASSSAAAAFPSAVISLLRGGDGQQLAAYTQVSYFQLENTLNLPPLDSVDSLRNAEMQALAGTGLQPTPIMLNASFDYELVQQGAIVGVPLDAGTEQKAVAALKKSLLPLAGAANVNAVMVSWFPRSISSGDEGHFVSLLREVEAGLPDKQVFLDTGFSTAFNSGDQQSQFMTIALTNLAGLRATEGADGRFLGVDVSQALSGSAAEAQALAGSSDPSQWNWSEKARQLAQMWSQGGKSADLTSWLAQIRTGRALLTTQAGGTGFVPSPGLQAVQQFSAAVAQVSQNMTPATTSSAGQTALTPGQTPSSPDTTTSTATMPSQGFNPSSAAMPASAAALPTAAPPAGPSTPSVYSQMLQSLVQQVTTQLTTALVTKLTSPKQSQYPAYAAQNGVPAYGQTIRPTTNYNASSQAPAYPLSQGASPVQSGAMISLGPQDVTLDAANPAAGQSVHITAQLHNSSVDQDISGLTVQLVDAGNPASPQASQSGVVVPRSTVVPVQLTWTAVQPNGATPTLLVQVLDVNGAQVASAGVPAMANTYGGANPGTASYASANGSNAGSSTTLSQAGQGLASSNSQSGTQTAAVQPQIVYFGPATATAQNPSFSLQVTNPAATLISSAQAQLFVDGKPGPTQALGPILPSQTRSANFDSAMVAGGNHNIKVVVTTADGASATAAAPPAASPASTRSANVNKLTATGVRNGLSVRSGLPAGYQIGTVRTAPVPAPVQTRSLRQPTQTRIVPQGVSGINQAGGINQGGTASTVVPPSGASHPTAVRTVLPQGSTNQPGTTATAGPSAGPQTTAVRTVPPQGSPLANSAPSTASQTTTVASVFPPGRGLPGRPFGATANSVPARAYLDLSVAAAEIAFRPAAPGKSTTFTAVIHNLGTLGAQGASVVFTLKADGRITSSRPSVFNIPAGGSFQASWTSPMPAGQNVQLEVQVTAKGDINPANNQAAIRLH